APSASERRDPTPPNCRATKDSGAPERSQQPKSPPDSIHEPTPEPVWKEFLGRGCRARWRSHLEGYQAIVNGRLQARKINCIEAKIPGLFMRAPGRGRQTCLWMRLTMGQAKFRQKVG